MEMSKQAKASGLGRNSVLHRLLLASTAAIGCLYAMPAAMAQQAYYLPQASSATVSVNYGALTPYAPAPYAPQPYAPAYAPTPYAPTPYAVPGGYQPYGYPVPSARPSAAPKSVFTPYGQGVPAYGYSAQPAYGYPAVPNSASFVAPYANPAFAPGMGNRIGLPISTPTGNSYPQSYLYYPGGQQYADAQPTKKKRKKKKAAALPPASTPTATENGAAAQVAAAEAVLESAPAATPSTPTQSAKSQTATPVVAAPESVPVAAEPVPDPTPPSEPETVPASVPSPAGNAPASAVAAAASSGDATPETASTSSQPAEQVASAEVPANTNAGTGAPAGGARIVFDSGSDDLPQSATTDLDALADKMAGDQNLKVQVLAYSSGTADAESQARRKALARGLEVRKYLIGKGVRSNRIDVRALGTKSEGGPADRVDIVPSAG